MLQTGVTSQIMRFLAYISFIIAFLVLIILKGFRKTYTGSLECWSDLYLGPPMAQTGVKKSHILWGFAFISFLLPLLVLNVLGGNKKPNTGSLENCHIYHYGSNWGHKITVFLAFIFFIIVITLFECVRPQTLLFLVWG